MLPRWSAVPRLAGWLLVAALHPSGFHGQRLHDDLSRDAQHERALTAGESHRFVVRLDRGQHGRVILEQDGVDVTMTLIGAEGEKLAVAEGPPATVGFERLALVADNAGGYAIEVRAQDRFPDRGRYRITLTDVRPASDADRKAVAAERLLADGERLRASSGSANARSALTKFEAALPLAVEAGNTMLAGDALTGIGRARQDLGEVAGAIELFRQALAKYAAAGAPDREAAALNHLALAHNFRAERPQAIELLQRALVLARATGDIRTEGVALNNLGLVHYDQREIEQALKHYLEALPLHRRAGNRRGEAVALSGIAAVRDARGDTAAALQYLQQALALQRVAGTPRDIATIINNIGAIYRALDDYPKALEMYREAIAQWQAAGDRTNEGVTRQNAASALNAFGETQQAIDAYREALRLHRETAFVTGEVTILNNLGVLYSQLGDRDAAIATYDEALSKNRAGRNRVAEAGTLVNLGLAWLSRGDHQRALSLLRDARVLAQQISDPLREAAAVTAIARVLAAAGDAGAAADAYREATDRHRALGSKRGEAQARAGLGMVAAQRGDQAAALGHYEAARDLYRLIADAGGEAQTLHRIAEAHQRLGKLDDALSASRSSRLLAESQRHRVASADLRSTYLGAVRAYYELEIDVLMQMHARTPEAGHDIEAFAVSERARARSLLEVLAEAGAAPTAGIDPGLVERERALAAAVSVKAERRTRLLSGPHAPAAADAASRDVATAIRELDDLRGRMRAAGTGYAALTDIQPLSLPDVRRGLLDEHTTLLEYTLAGDRSYVWIVSATGHWTLELAPRQTIAAAARRFYDALKTPENNEWEAAGRALSALIFAPAADYLRTERLVVVADGPLQYVPFAALPVRVQGRYEPAIVRHEVTSAPSASSLVALRARSPRLPSRLLAVIADPVFSADDVRVRRRAPAQASTRTAVPAGPQPPARLIGSRREAAAILNRARGINYRALDFEASRDRVLEGLSQYRFVHFATHAFFDSAQPELSALVLSLVDEAGAPQNGFLRLSDIYNLRLSADLVVLSACQTALGRDVHGEGLIGLVRGFMSAGAPRIVASLWKVDDRATTALMTSLYQSLLSATPQPAGTALRRAQLAVRAEPRWRSPYHWAGFTLQGDWR
jgi:CHAT domain-containing protein/tetratricopeptide (TPR) repeat protein